MPTSSKTFCIHPWIHQQSTPGGRINFCCVSNKSFITNSDGRSLHLAQDHFSDAWNTPYMKQIRQKMLSGEKVKGCETCYQQEEFGKRSHRQSYNEEWTEKLGLQNIEERVSRSMAQGYHVVEAPIYLDLRLGNLCNLKCRMCNPENSVKIQKEWEQIDSKTAGRYSQFWSQYNSRLEASNNWFEKRFFWENVDAMIPQLKKVYITGGEPTLIEGYTRFLDKCVELGKAQDIEIFVNTNMVVFNDEFIAKIRPFKNIGINASLDGHGIINEYIRAPSRWKNIDRNFKLLAKEGGPSLSLGVSLVVQSYNILYLADLLEYGEEVLHETGREVHFDFLNCFRPAFLDFIHLPENIKKEAAARLSEYRSHSKLYRSKAPRAVSLRDGVDATLRRLTDVAPENSERIVDFIRYTKTLDQQRNQSIQATMPELVFLLEEAGYHFSKTDSLFVPSPA